jgi:hypothetical protein
LLNCGTDPNVSKCLSTDKWINKYDYTKYFSTLKNKQILAYVTLWMNLGDVILNEISFSQVDNTI